MLNLFSQNTPPCLTQIYRRESKKGKKQENKKTRKRENEKTGKQGMTKIVYAISYIERKIPEKINSRKFAVVIFLYVCLFSQCQRGCVHGLHRITTSFTDLIAKYSINEQSYLIVKCELALFCLK